jgi:hypothetical protein
MMAVASLILSTPALTCDSHSGWSGWPSRSSGDEGLVAADDDHDQQVGDHDHVDQAEHGQHDVASLRLPALPSPGGSVRP